MSAPPPPDGSPASEMSDQEKEMIKLCIKTIIRTYMIDFYMRGIFSNSVFTPDTQPDDLYIKSVVEFILTIWSLMTSRTWFKLEMKLSQWENTELIRMTFLLLRMKFQTYTKNQKSLALDLLNLMTSAKEAVVSFIEEQYMDVYRLMKQKINSLMLSDIESRFVLEYIPIVNYQGAYVTSGERVFTGLGNLDRSVDWAEVQQFSGAMEISFLNHIITWSMTKQSLIRKIQSHGRPSASFLNMT